MHQAGARRRGDQHPDHGPHLFRIRRRQALHRQGQRPDAARHAVLVRMRAADALAEAALAKIGIGLAQHAAPGVLIDRIVRGHITQVGRRQQAGNIGVVHDVHPAQAVHFVCPNPSMLGVAHAPVAFDAAPHLTADPQRRTGHFLVAVHVTVNAGAMLQDDSCEHVCRNQIGEGARIVTRPEPAPHHTGIARRRAGSDGEGFVLRPPGGISGERPAPHGHDANFQLALPQSLLPHCSPSYTFASPHSATGSGSVRPISSSL